jgi:hypothetical protein
VAIAPRRKPARPVHPKGIGTAVSDAGYLSKRNCTEPGPNRLITTGERRAAEKRPAPPTTDPPPRQPDEENEPDPIEEMADRLRTCAYFSAAPPELP